MVINHNKNMGLGRQKMKKKAVSLILSAIMILSLTACGSGTEKDKKEADGTTNKSGTIRILNGKIEINSALQDFAKKYENKTGQKIEIESIGGDTDASTVLKGYVAADNIPDIFVFEIGSDMPFNEYMEDLSDCEFASRTDYAYKDDEGRVLGFPYSIEGYGLTYNADILETAGVDPATLINYKGWEEALNKIDSQKDELGLSAVCSMAAESGSMWWACASHLWGYYVSGGLEQGDSTYLDKIWEGKLDNTRLLQFAKFTNMLFDHSDQNILVSGTYDDQLALFAQGKTAFISQGNWIDPELPNYDVNFACGIVPYAFTEEDMTGIESDAPSYWGVSKNSDKIDACKEFLDTLALSDEGQACLIKECGLVSPYKDMKEEVKTPLAKSLSSYVEGGRTYPWIHFASPDGLSNNILAPAFELMAKDELDPQGFVDILDKNVAEYVSQNVK